MGLKAKLAYLGSQEDIVRLSSRCRSRLLFYHAATKGASQYAEQTEVMRAAKAQANG